MPNQTPPRYAVAVRACTIHTGRFRWDIHRDGVAVLSSPNSYVSETEALRAGAEEILRLPSDDQS
jgi:hypothetical protein